VVRASGFERSHGENEEAQNVAHPLPTAAYAPNFAGGGLNGIEHAAGGVAHRKVKLRLVARLYNAPVLTDLYAGVVLGCY